MDQWDIYKLDPEYDCVVRAHPNLTAITRVTPQRDTINPDDTFISGFRRRGKRPSAPHHNYNSTPEAKRDRSPSCSDTESPRQKRHKPTGVNRTLSSQTDYMSVDEDSYDQAKVEDFINRKKRRWAPDSFEGKNVSEAEKLNGKAPEHKGLKFDYLITTG